MLISDLNILEAVEGSAVVGGTFRNISIRKTAFVNEAIVSTVFIRGNSGVATADARAFGNNALAQTDTNSSATNFSASANSLSLSAVS